MNHFLEISQLTRQQVDLLLQRALYFKNNRNFPHYSQHRLATLFYENSTRTRVSFELAASHLSIPTINFDLSHSSEQKGEVIADTISTLAAMGIDIFVMRHSQEGIQQNLAECMANQIHLINAGDGKHAHPSQAMLDLMTIIEKKPSLSELKIAIVGNISHSRVANSLQCLFSLLGVGELILVAPSLWQPEKVHFGRVTDDLYEGIREADVIIGLRVQRERLTEDESLDLSKYRKHFALTQTVLKWAKHDAMILHPGPINRGVEIDSDVVDGPQSFILEQVKNGVFMRMAIIEFLLRKTSF